MAEPWDVEVPTLPLHRLARVVGEERFGWLLQIARATAEALQGRKVWNVNSTAVGGGVAEMLQLLVGYGVDAGIDTHWVVIEGDPEFFSITKRLHNQLHGVPGDGGNLGRGEDAHYRVVCRDNAQSLSRRVRPGDIVILHDPQTAGMANDLSRRGARIVWRCHIGTAQANDTSRAAWSFLVPHLAACDAFVFSMAAFVPPQLAGPKVWIIEPSIDPLSEKNRAMRPTRSLVTLGRIGLLEGQPVTVPGIVLGGAGPLPASDRLVVQVSRWDRLKDMLGVMRGFAEHVAGRTEASLALVGPSVEGVADDPEGTGVLTECLDLWRAMPDPVRRVIRLVALPTDDRAANALMVNAIQRHATIVVQKSIQEGFGLTLAESMWKSRPVVASAVGGMVDQVAPGTGLLLDDPHDLETFGRTLVRLLGEPAEMARLGRQARRHVRARFLTDRHLIDYARLLEQVGEH